MDGQGYVWPGLSSNAQISLFQPIPRRSAVERVVRVVRANERSERSSVPFKVRLSRVETGPERETQRDRERQRKIRDCVKRFE